MASKIWLITGAASGIGRAVTENALANGDIVIATDLRPDGLSSLQSVYPSDKLVVRKLDVSIVSDIVAAFDAAKETFGRIDVVLSNAGYVISGELEGIPTEAGRKLFDVNFWGSTQVSLQAIKFFREVNGPGIGGRLLVTSSFVGIASIPIGGYYVASKHALEGAIETLASELDPNWNIKITMVEAGTFKTNVITSSQAFPLHPAYSNPALPVHFMRSQFATNTGANPKKLAMQIHKISQLPEPPVRLAIGQDAIAIIKDQINKISKGLDEYQSWSQDLGFDDE